MEDKLQSFAKLFQQPRPEPPVRAQAKAAPTRGPATVEKRVETPLPPAPSALALSNGPEAPSAVGTPPVANTGPAAKSVAPVKASDDVVAVRQKGPSAAATQANEAPLAAQQSGAPVAAVPVAAQKAAVQKPAPVVAKPPPATAKATKESAPTKNYLKPVPQQKASPANTNQAAGTPVARKESPPAIEGKVLPGVKEAATPPLAKISPSPKDAAPSLREKPPATVAKPPVETIVAPQEPTVPNAVEFPFGSTLTAAKDRPLPLSDAPTMAAALMPEQEAEKPAPTARRRIRLGRARIARGEPEQPEMPPSVSDPISPRRTGARLAALVVVLVLAIGGVAAIWVARMQTLTVVAEETEEPPLITDVPTVRPAGSGTAQIAGNQSVPVNSPVSPPMPPTEPSTDSSAHAVNPATPASSPSPASPPLASKSEPPAAAAPPASDAQLPPAVPAPTASDAKVSPVAVAAPSVSVAAPPASAIPPKAPEPLTAGGGEAQWLKYALPMPAPSGRPWIALVIDDLGLDKKRTERAISLRGPITMSFLAYAGDLLRETEEARRNGHELIVHVPMEPMSRTQNPGQPTNLDSGELLRRLRWDLGRFDGYVGIDNHIGGRFTSDPGGTMVVLGELKARGLVFLDSRTDGSSTGYAIAERLGLPTAERDVFLDDEINATAIDARLADLERIARRNGTALAIGHPHDQTLDALTVWLAELSQRGFQLVPLTAIVKQRNLHVAGLSAPAK
jgi:uncharacterized protein